MELKAYLHLDRKQTGKDFAAHQLEVQRRPYAFLMTQTELINSYAFLPKLVLGTAIGGIWAAYHLRRHNEIGRLLSFKVSGDMVFSVYWRVLVGFIAGERLGSRYFADHLAIMRHRWATNEVRKAMRFVPNAKPHLRANEKPNSYFFV